MTTAPITTPGRILSTALYAALSPLVGSHDGIPAVYWLQAPGPGPAQALLAGQLAGVIAIHAISTAGSQVNQAVPRGAFLDAGYIGEAGVAGRILVKAFATTDDAAQDLMAAAAAAIGAGLVASTGYAISAQWAAEVLLPPLDGIHTAAAVYSIALRRVATVTPPPLDLPLLDFSQPTHSYYVGAI